MNTTLFRLILQFFNQHVVDKRNIFAIQDKWKKTIGESDDKSVEICWKFRKWTLPAVDRVEKMFSLVKLQLCPESSINWMEIYSRPSVKKHLKKVPDTNRGDKKCQKWLQQLWATEIHKE